MESNPMNNHASTPQPNAHAISFRELFQALWQGKWYILLSVILAVAGAILYIRTATPVYEASSIVFVNSEPSINEVLSRDLAIALERKLQNEIGFLEYSIPLAKRVAQHIAEIARRQQRTYPILINENGKPLPINQVALRLKHRVSFSIVPGMDMISISATSSEPEEAALIANAYAQEYRQRSKESRRANIAAARAFLEEQEAKRRAELQKLEAQWEAYNNRYNTYTIGEDGKLLIERLAQLDEQLENARLELQIETIALQDLQTKLAQFNPQGIGDFSQIQSEIQALDTRLAELRLKEEDFYAVNPNLRNAPDKPAELRDIIQRIQRYTARRKELAKRLLDLSRNSESQSGADIAYLNSIKQQITEKESRIKYLNTQIELLQARIAKGEEELRNLPKRSVTLAQLARSRQAATQLYTNILNKLEEIRIAEESEHGYVDVVREASVPIFPVRPNPQQSLILALLLGLIVGIGTAILKHSMGSRPIEPELLQQRGLRIIGVIPPMDRMLKNAFNGENSVQIQGRPVSTALITLHDPWSYVAENFRLIFANLQFAQNTKNVKSILVTSSVPFEGKTLTAVNLSIALAQAGRRTLYIDADLRRPSGHKILGGPRQPGLTDILQQPQSIHWKQFETPINNLYCLPAGSMRIHPTTVLSSQRLEQLLKHVHEVFDIIVIDSPPVLAATDALLLSTKTDATIIVASAKHADIDKLNRTHETLRSVGANIAGIVINRYSASRHSYYGYTSYEYEYTEDITEGTT